MVLYNRGPAVARNVNLRYELPDGDKTLPGILDAGLLPVPLLDSGQRYPIMVIFAQGDAMVFDVIVTWEDDEGPKEKRLRAPGRMLGPLPQKASASGPSSAS